MVKRELTVGGLICHLASEMHFHSQKISSETNFRL